MVRGEECDGHGRRQRERGRHELEAAHVEGDRSKQSSCERDPPAPAEGEVERRHEQRQRGRGGDADSLLRGPRGQANGKKRPEGGKHAEAVPVTQRLGESRSADRIEDAQALGKESCEQPVPARHGDCSPDPREECGQRPAGENDACRREDGNVERSPFGLQDRTLRNAPDARRCHPPGERGKADDRCDFERAQPNLAQDDPGRDHPDRDDREQSPDCRVIGAVAERGADHCEGPENGHEETVGPNRSHVPRDPAGRPVGCPAGEAHVARLITHAPPLGDCGRPELLFPPSQAPPRALAATDLNDRSYGVHCKLRRPDWTRSSRITPPRLSSAARERWEMARC